MGHRREQDSLWRHAGLVAKDFKTHKVCITCGEDKPIRSYYRYRRNKDGHLNQCKRCFLEARKRREADRCINSAWTEE